MAKIMLVDDAAFMRMMIKNTLTQQGYTDIVEAQDGAEAVTKFAEENPDLVFMDITMPNMDGLQALKKIKENSCNTANRADCNNYFFNIVNYSTGNNENNNASTYS